MMSSNGFLHSLDIDRRACRRVPALVVCSLLLALTAVSLSGLPWLPRGLRAGLLLASTLRELHRAWPGSPRGVSHIQIAPDGRFSLACGRGSLVLVPATVLHWWILAGFAMGVAWVGTDGRWSQALLFRDRLAPDVWRRLLVRLRHGPAHCSG